LVKAGKIKLHIFSVARFFKQAERLVIAAFFTSCSLSERSWVKVWIRLLSVISLPKAPAN
jgi:hypothetical protein